MMASKDWKKINRKDWGKSKCRMAVVRDRKLIRVLVEAIKHKKIKGLCLAPWTYEDVKGAIKSSDALWVIVHQEERKADRRSS